VTLPEKTQRTLAITCIREEVNLKNIELLSGGFRSNSKQYDWCVAAFSANLGKLGYNHFADLVNPVVKHALMSVLKTEGRKTEEKVEAYKTMLSKGKVRVKRWRLSRRMKAEYGSEQSLLGTEAEIRLKNEKVLVCFDFWFSNTTSL
jgi:hypothetical protein